MGQIDFPRCTIVEFNPQKKTAADAVPADLTDCRSPLSQWELPTTFFPSADNGERCLQPTGLDQIPTFIPDAIAPQQPCGSGSDQMNLQGIEVHPVPAFIPEATTLQQPYLPTVPISFATEPMPCVYMMPVIMPQQHVGFQPMEVSELGYHQNQLDASCSPVEISQMCPKMHNDDALPLNSDLMQTSDETRGSYAAEGVGPRLSASAARRRRRQHAATLRAQEGIKHEPGAHQGAYMKIDAKDSRHSKISCADMLTRLETGGEGLTSVLEEVVPLVRQLTFEAEGCRVVQLALQKAGQRERATICAELHGCVRRAIASPHGNYVLQRVVELMPATLSSFVSSELLNVGADTARHRFGCRIMCRLLEHCSAHPWTIQLIDEILLEAQDLCCHSFAHHVMESVLEHGTAEQKHRIALALQADWFADATDAHATYVIESALRNCSLPDRRAIGAVFLADKDALLSIAEHNSGFHVVRALLKYSEQSSPLAAILREERGRLQSSDNGSRILALSYQAA